MNFDYDEMLKELDYRKFGSTNDYQILNEARALSVYTAAYEDFNKSIQYKWLKESTEIKYIVGAMLPVANNYTQQIISCRNSVEHVLTQMNSNVYSNAHLEFEYQGSVSNNTHIRKK